MYSFSCYLTLSFKNYLHYSIDITTEQNFRYIHGTNIWILKIALLSQVFANQVTYIHTYIHTHKHTYIHEHISVYAYTALKFWLSC